MLHVMFMHMHSCSCSCSCVVVHVVAISSPVRVWRVRGARSYATATVVANLLTPKLDSIEARAKKLAELQAAAAAEAAAAAKAASSERAALATGQQKLQKGQEIGFGMVLGNQGKIGSALLQGLQGQDALAAEIAAMKTDTRAVEARRRRHSRPKAAPPQAAAAAATPAARAQRRSSHRLAVAGAH